MFGGTTTSLFGQPQPQTTSLFGQTQQPQQSTSLFGQSQQPQQSTSLFGQSQQPQTNSLFGQSQQPQQSTSLFGQSQQPQQSTSLFGQAQQPQSTSLFGSNSLGSTGSLGSLGSTSSLGSLGSTSSLGSLGSTSSLGNTQSTSLFGQPQAQTSSFFAQPTNQQQQLQLQQQQLQLQQQQLQLQLQQQQRSIIDQRLYDFIQAVSPDSPTCKYIYWFYNYHPNVDPKTLPKPANVSVGDWQLALSNNPDPSNFIPVVAKSFNDLKQRREQQQEILKQLNQRSQETLKTMRDLENQLNFHVHSQLEMMRKKQIELVQRYIDVWSSLEIYQSKGKPFGSGEERLMKRIQEIYEELNQPNSIKSKVDEISNQLKLGSMEKEKIKYEITPEAIEPLYNLLKNMTISIERITNEIEIALTDSQTLKKELLQLNKNK